jgi:hypothetical protein
MAEKSRAIFWPRLSLIDIVAAYTDLQLFPRHQSHKNVYDQWPEAWTNFS